MSSHRCFRDECWHKPGLSAQCTVIACQRGQITAFHINTHPQYDNHVEVLQEKLRLLKTEFEGIKDDLDRRGDKYVFNVGLKFFEQTALFREGQDIAKEFVQLLEDQKTLTVLDQVRFAKK